MKYLSLLFLLSCTPDVFKAKLGECYLIQGDVFKVTSVGEYSVRLSNSTHIVTAPHDAVSYFKRMDCWE